MKTFKNLLKICRYFFNVSKSPMRELCYVTMTAGVFSVGVVFIITHILFCGLCLYIVGMYQALQNMLECIDRTSKVKIERMLRDCIEIHLAIMRYVTKKCPFIKFKVFELYIYCSFTEAFNAIYNHVIFVQYSYLLLSMCTNIFAVFLVSKIYINT